MNEQSYRFQFDRKVPAEDVETIFMLSLMAAQSLHGRTSLLMERESYALDVRARQCVIGTASAAGRDMARIFAGYALNFHGRRNVRIRRIDGAPGCRGSDRAGGRR